MVLPPLPAQVLNCLQKQNDEDTKGRFQIGVGRALEPPINLSRDSTQWNQETNGYWSCSVELEVTAALGLRIHLEQINLPRGSRILVYDPQKPALQNQTIDNTSLGIARDIWTDTQFSERLVIRCEIASESDLQNISLSARELSHIYRLPSVKAFKDAGCENDVTCYPDWAQEASAVARMIFMDQGQTYVCTGCLLATTKPTSKDYFLTARHCITSASLASTIELFWMYQTSTCNGDPPNLSNVPHTGGGADMTASDFPSDFAFLRLHQAAPSQAFHALWTTLPLGDGETVATIHHPNGSYKCISFGNSIGSDTDFSAAVRYLIRTINWLAN